MREYSWEKLNLCILKVVNMAAFTCVDTSSTPQRSPDIVRLEQGSVVRGINPSGCKTTETGEA